MRAPNKVLDFSKSLLLLIIWVASIANAHIEKVIGQVELSKNNNLPLFIPQVHDSEIIISRDQYVISYDAQRRIPHWVAWKLESKDIGKAVRSNNFETDAELDTYLKQSKGPSAVRPDEYDGTCFDRGHQSPSKDRTDSAENNKATFMMSNMIPQTPYLNRVIWEQLEQFTRNKIVKQHKKAYIIAGPVFDENFGAIGPNKNIVVPSKNFKLIFFLDENQGPEQIGPDTETIAVIMPNVLQDGSKPTMPTGRVTDCESLTHHSALANTNATSQVEMQIPEEWKKYQSSLSDIQKLTGLEFVKR